MSQSLSAVLAISLLLHLSLTHAQISFYPASPAYCNSANLPCADGLNCCRRPAVCFGGVSGFTCSDAAGFPVDSGLGGLPSGGGIVSLPPDNVVGGVGVIATPLPPPPLPPVVPGGGGASAGEGGVVTPSVPLPPSVSVTSVPEVVGGNVNGNGNGAVVSVPPSTFTTTPIPPSPPPVVPVIPVVPSNGNINNGSTNGNTSGTVSGSGSGPPTNGTSGAGSGSGNSNNSTNTVTFTGGAARSRYIGSVWWRVAIVAAGVGAFVAA